MYPRIDVQTEIGRLRLAFTNGDHVHVSTENRELVTFRGKTYSVAAHLYRVHDWQPDNGGDTRDSKVMKEPGGYNDHAAPTIRAKVLAACREAVLTYLKEDPGVLHRAALDDARTKLGWAESEENELREKYSAAMSKAAKARALVAELEAAGTES